MNYTANIYKRLFRKKIDNNFTSNGPEYRQYLQSTYEIVILFIQLIAKPEIQMLKDPYFKMDDHRELCRGRNRNVYL